MSDNWRLVYSTIHEYQAELVKQMLNNEGIEAQIMNKRDSFYITIGELEVYVPAEDVIQSLKLIEEFKSE